MTKPYEVAGKTRAEAEALAARQGLTNPVFTWITSGLYVLRFEVPA
jgi:hypothetical protein